MNKEGCGLGLTISKNLAIALGSDLQVKSEEGKGTKMYMIFKELPKWNHPEGMDKITASKFQDVK